MFKLYDLATDPVIDGTEELYYRKKDNHIVFDTYFNMIPVRKLKHYTTISELIFSQEVLICTESGELRSGNRITLQEIPDNAECLYIKIKGNELTNITVYAEGEEQKVKIAIVICTYQREDCVKENIDYLLRFIKDTEYEIILVDNASSIPEDNWDNRKVTVLHNVNNGGSGGYSCGMKYAAEKKQFTHILLMDDDVKLDYVSLQRTFGFLTALKKEYTDISIAGSMLYSDMPTKQFESGGYFSSSGEQTGYGYNFDMTDKSDLIENEKDKDINYAGWWFACMPIRYVNEGQFPSPYFIKYDDVEYALRCRMNIITLNGVGVWHESFSRKYNSVQVYFNTRNYLFLMKKHNPGFMAKKEFGRVMYLLFEKLCRQQYKMAQAVIIGYKDYLKGEKYLTQIDYQKKLSELQSLNYHMMPDDELYKKYEVRFDNVLYHENGSAEYKKYMKIFLYGQLMPKFMCRKLTVTDVLADRKEHYFKADKTLHYNIHDKTGYVTKKSLRKTLYMLIELYKLRLNKEKS